MTNRLLFAKSILSRRNKKGDRTKSPSILTPLSWQERARERDQSFADYQLVNLGKNLSTIQLKPGKRGEVKVSSPKRVATNLS